MPFRERNTKIAKTTQKSGSEWFTSESTILDCLYLLRKGVKAFFFIASVPKPDPVILTIVSKERNFVGRRLENSGCFINV